MSLDIEQASAPTEEQLKQAADGSTLEDLVGLSDDEFERQLLGLPATEDSVDLQPEPVAPDSVSAQDTGSADETPSHDVPAEDARSKPVVPIQALHEERDKRRNAETKATELEQELERIKATLPQTQPQTLQIDDDAELVKSYQDELQLSQRVESALLAQHRSAVEKLAEDFNEGKIDAVEWKKQEFALQDDLHTKQQAVLNRRAEIHGALQHRDSVQQQRVMDSVERAVKAVNDEVITPNLSWLQAMSETDADTIDALVERQMRKENLYGLNTPQAIRRNADLFVEIARSRGFDNTLTQSQTPPPPRDYTQPSAQQLQDKRMMAQGGHPPATSSVGTPATSISSTKQEIASNPNANVSIDQVIDAFGDELDKYLLT